MNEQVLKEVSQKLKISLKQVNTVLDLLDEGNTIPFIARYRRSNWRIRWRTNKFNL